MGIDTVIDTIAVNPNQPASLYVGTYAHGLLKSGNGGATWQTSNSGLSQQILAAKVDPVSPTIIYAGTNGGGLYKSIDGGQNWQTSLPNLGGFLGVWQVVIDPAVPSTLYVAGIAFDAMGSEPGIFRSHNAGLNWTPVVNGLPGLSFINSMAIHPVTSSILYGAEQGGVYKTTNQGDSWTLISNGLNEFINTLVMDPTAPDTLYVGTTIGSVFKTVDGGQNWQKIKQFDSGDLYTIVSVDVLAINPVTPTILYAATKKQDSNPISRVFMSTDGGANWQDLQLYVLTVKQMLVDPNSPGVLYVATESGVLQYTDAGWESAGLQDAFGVNSLGLVPGSDPPALIAGAESGLYLASLPLAASDPIDLALTKSVTPTLAAPGQVVTYTLTFTNLGSGSVSRADFFDQITPPGGATNIRSSLPITLGVMSPQMYYFVGAIPPGGSGVITYNVALWTPMPVGYVVSSNASIHGVDTTGATDPITANNYSVVDVTIKNVPPRLSFVSPKTVNEGSLLAFSLDAYDDNGTPLTYSLVNAPAGAALQSGNQFRWSPTEAQGPGAYTVTFIASDGVLTDSQTAPLTVNEVNQPPVAVAGPDQSVQIGAAVALNGGGSFDLDDQPLTYGWRQTGGPAVTLNQADAVSTTFTAPVSPAVLTFSLTVTDSFGVAASADTIISVSDLPPSGLQVNADVLSLLGHQTYFTSSLVSGSNPVFTWAFGDGDTGSGVAVSHTYATAGFYTTTVTSTNAAGSVANSIRVRVVPGEALLPVSPDHAAAVIIPIEQHFTASLAAPAGAVTNGLTLVFSSTVGGPAAPAGQESTGIRFLLDAYQGIDSPPAQTFAAPLRLALTYTNEAIAGLDENSLTLAYWTSDTWAETGLTLVERQPAENRLDYEVAHLTEFELFGEKLKTYLPVILK